MSSVLVGTLFAMKMPPTGDEILPPGVMHLRSLRLTWAALFSSYMNLTLKIIAKVLGGKD